MRKATTALLIALGLSLLLALAATAQKPGPTPSDWNYDPATVETVKGTITHVVSTVFGGGRRGGGAHLMVDTGRELLEVPLGPLFYLEENEFEAAAGDEVEITGSRITSGGNELLIARELRSGDFRLELRDKDGTPHWAGERGPRRGGAGMGMGPGERAGQCDCHHCHGCGGCAAAGSCRRCGNR